MPSSTTRPRSSTQIRSACRTVENRCEIKNRRGVPGRGQNAVEDLCLPADVELRGRLIQKHHTCPASDATQRPRECHSLPLSAGKIGAPLIAT